MSIDEIKKVYSKIIDDFLDNKIDRDEAVSQLLDKLNPNEILDTDDFFITDCYYAIKYLTEDGFETPLRELEYFRECFNGKREYDNNEKGLFINGEN